jgi:alginate O-acetyltransferase complex protein AlgI
MLFNSVEFALFLPFVWLVFTLLERRSFRSGNAWILAASLFFYGWWDPRFLILVFFSGALDFIAALRIQSITDQRKKRGWLIISMVGNLGLLAAFKYFDFFLRSFTEAFTLLGMELDIRPLGIILPVGISFYTFQSMSYTIDVWRGDLKPTRDPIVFGAYLMFFPQLVAGPIERGTALLPQFQRTRRFDRAAATDGLRQMLWGLFKKVVIADQCAPQVDHIFASYDSLGAGELMFGAVLFAFQIYGDFSGYSDIAIGCSRLFGISLMRNFNFPYFSRDIAEFWRRWHISLSTWFRDYLYVPLGGSRGGRIDRVRNTFIVFLASGFWHGANYTFLVWGAIHAALFLPLLLSNTNRRHTGPIAPDRFLPSAADASRMVATFMLVAIAWVFFRAPDISIAWSYVSSIPKDLIANPWQLLLLVQALIMRCPMPFIWIMLLFEWMARDEQHALAMIHSKWRTPIRWTIYYALVLIALYYFGEEQTFIYFQF